MSGSQNLLPPTAAAAVLPLAEREQAEWNEEQRQEDDVARRQSKHDQGDGYADCEGAQHLRLLVLRMARRETETPSVPRPRLFLLVAANGLVGVTSAGQVVAG
jgi:hypothetical protein